MFNEDYDLVSHSALNKVTFMKRDRAGYLVSSMMAGIFVGLGMILTYVEAGLMEGSMALKPLQGFSFAMALSLVVIGGSDLFTGNNLVMTTGFIKKRIKITDAITLWILCYLGNLAGSIFIAALFTGAGLASGNTASAVASGILAKTSPEALQIFIRGVLCNILVCAAIWCTYRAKSESGKLIMIFWCIFAFIIMGFEHCVANMTLFSLGLLSSAVDSAMIRPMGLNLIFATLGNLTGGALFSAAYYCISRRAK